MIQEELLQKVIETIAEAFEIDPGTIQPASRLNEDLDIDSIDAVDLLIRLKPLAGRRLQPETFKSVRTVQDVVDALHALPTDMPLN
ncbi:MAG: acyl carrier protein [Betaproteobacteria bacterium]|jgi:acyl carrier protein|nr:acyl carrier protein [Betaproteobacteria bacterium]MBK8106477.1 acyl carrier protein [Betaproteobacteria bacterium]